MPWLQQAHRKGNCMTVASGMWQKSSSLPLQKAICVEGCGVGRGKGARTLIVEDALQEILQAQRPMTVRQAYYQLVSRQVVENTRGAYQAVSNILVTMRQEGTIPWEWIEDRMRRPRSVSMWNGLSDFAETAVQAYRRNVWQDQERLVELWVEKDALSGIFEEEAEPYGVTVNVGPGVSRVEFHRESE